MTDLTTPPDDPQLQLAWARRALRDFSRQNGLLGAKEIRAIAREIIREHSPTGLGASRARHPRDKPISK